MATMTEITPPTASDLPKKERRLKARFGGLGFDVEMMDNDAETLFIVFIVGDSRRCRRMTDQIRLRFSYLFNLWIIETFSLANRRSDFMIPNQRTGGGALFVSGKFIAQPITVLGNF
jgi:hypothetical protein